MAIIPFCYDFPKYIFLIEKLQTYYSMKAIVTLLFLFFSIQFSIGQDVTDALRYSFLTGQGGTARNQALGGAGVSLGGEFSTLFLNPAGLGFFKTGDFVITPSVIANSNEAEYLGNTMLASNQKLSLGATGIILSTEYRNRKIKNLTIGIGINRSANFNNITRYEGINNTSSYSEKFAEELEYDNVTNSQVAGSSYPYGASMAFNTYLINPVLNSTGDITGYTTLANPAYGLKQMMNKNTSGGITDIAFGIGANYSDKFFWGGALTIPVLKYHREADYQEDDMSGNSHNDFGYFTANEILETKGTGVNLKAGVIYKPLTSLQLGLSFVSPTFFQMTDLYNMTITTNPEGYEGQGVLTQSSSFLNNDDDLRATYNMVTPLRVMFGGTYFFSTGPFIDQQKGFITADLEYVNYSGTRFLDANNDQNYKTYYKQLNNTIEGTYKGTINARIGGEIKFNVLMIRLGAAYYGNPYENETTSLFKTTGGLGYRNRGFYIDLGYTLGIQKAVDYPYNLNRINVSPANLNNNSSNIALTLGFKLY